MKGIISQSTQIFWTKDDLCYESPYDVCYFDIDQDKSMYLSSILQYMMETSIRHIISLKLSYWDTQHLDVTWIFRRGHLIVHENPVLNDKIVVKSYASDVNKFFTQRDYILTNKEGDIMAEFSTEWILFNYKTRRPCRIEEVVGALPIDEGVIPLSAPNFKVKLDGEIIHSDWYSVRNMDIDFNGHVNNVCYSKWVNDSIPRAFQNNRTVSDYFIEIKNEALLGDRVYIDHLRESDMALKHVIRNEDGSKVYGIARSEFHS